MSRLTITVAEDGAAVLTLYGVSGQAICFTGPLIDVMPMFDELAQAMNPEGLAPVEDDLSEYDDLSDDDGEGGLEEARPEPFDLHDDAEALASAGFGTDEDYGGPMQ